MNDLALVSSSCSSFNLLRITRPNLVELSCEPFCSTPQAGRWVLTNLAVSFKCCLFCSLLQVEAPISALGQCLCTSSSSEVKPTAVMHFNSSHTKHCCKLPTLCRGSRTMLVFSKGMCSNLLVFHPRTPGKCWPASLQKQAEGWSQGRPFYQKWTLTQMKGVAIGCLKSNSCQGSNTNHLRDIHCSHLLYYIRFH